MIASASMDVSFLTELISVHALFNAVMSYDRLHALVFTETPFGIRVISFRKANHREVKKYEDGK